MSKPPKGPFLKLTTQGASFASKDKNLTDFDCRVLFGLMANLNGWGTTVDVTQEELAEYIGAQRNSVSRSLMRLCNYGYITKLTRGRYSFDAQIAIKGREFLTKKEAVDDKDEPREA